MKNLRNQDWIPKMNTFVGVYPWEIGPKDKHIPHVAFPSDPYMIWPKTKGFWGGNSSMNKKIKLSRGVSSVH